MVIVIDATKSTFDTDKRRVLCKINKYINKEDTGIQTDLCWAVCVIFQPGTLGGSVSSLSPGDA